jgi:hypothetical protein
VLWATVVAIVVALAAPGVAAAHGPVNLAATSFEATVTGKPPGVRAIVVDGDQRMWMSAVPSEDVLVLDYRGAPYLRFSAGGVEVNRNSSMYYLNQVPAELVPAGIGPHTPPSWSLVTHGHGYSWHDGRLHALATTALAPGTRYVGAWSIPVVVEGHSTRITGGLRYAPNPSLVWFWPIVVALACVLAALRVRRSGVDTTLARGLALLSLLAFAVAGAGQQLHGRPGVAPGQYVVLALMLAFVAWGLLRLARRRDGWFGYFLIALAAIWEGATLVGVLTHGFVLVALPAFLARATVTACLAAGAGLLAVIFRLAERPEGLGLPRRPVAAGALEPDEFDEDPEWDDDL